MRKVIIIDDEQNARAVIKGMLNENFQNIEVVGEAKDLPNGVLLIRQLKPHIVFLDIEMPEHSGLEILDFFGENEIDFQIVFVTAYDQFALEAFKLSAIDYIVKPIQLDELKRAINKAGNFDAKSFNAIVSNQTTEKTKKLVVNVGGVQHIIKIDDIIYVKADGSYSHLILKDGTKHLLTKKLIEFEVLEQFPDFLRIHRSHIINIQHISKIYKVDGGSIEMINGDELSISKEKKNELENKLEILRI